MQEKRNESYVCDCLPGCYEIAYDTEVSMAPLLDTAPILRKKRYAPENVSALNIFYKLNSFRSEIKGELIGFTDFLCKNDHSIVKNIN